MKYVGYIGNQNRYHHSLQDINPSAKQKLIIYETPLVQPFGKGISPREV